MSIITGIDFNTENKDKWKKWKEALCETCDGDGYIEIMGGEYDDVIDTKPCPECNEEDL